MIYKIDQSEKIVGPVLAESIQWKEESTCYLVYNPRLPAEDLELLKNAKIPFRPGQVWIMSSGTSQDSKSQSTLALTGLSLKGMCLSAEAVNAHLAVKPNDIWLNTLPIFHVGGLSIYVRAQLSHSKVISYRPAWSPLDFVKALTDHSVSLTSLVPTQVYDLVKAGLRAPANLRCAIVGGGYMSSELYGRAKALGWPVLASFGMTETSSQIATAKPDDQSDFPVPRLLSHVQVKLLETDKVKSANSGLLLVNGPSLFIEKLFISSRDSRLEKRLDSWWPSQDLIELITFKDGGLGLVPLGRQDDLKKVSGELVSQIRLQTLLENCMSELQIPAQGAILFRPDLRRENQIYMVLDQSLMKDSEKVLKLYAKKTKPFEAPMGVFFVNQIPKTDLGKIKYKILEENLFRQGRALFNEAESKS